MYQTDPRISFFLQNNKYIIQNIFLITVIFGIAVLFIFIFSKKTSFKYTKIFFLSLIYHTSFSIFYYFKQSWPPKDTGRFFMEAIKADNYLELFSTPSQYVGSFLYPFIKYFKMSFFTGFMLFNVIGYLALLIFFLAAEEQIRGNKKAERLLVFGLFMPGINFWTSVISKESINIFGVALIIYSLVNIKRRLVYLLFGMIIIAPLRPHILIMILFALAISVVMTENIDIAKKALIIILIIIVSVPVFNHFKKMTSLEKIDVETAVEYMDQRSDSWGGGSAVDLQKYSVPARFFTFLYRPLFFDAHHIFMVFASMENLIYLIITLQMLSIYFIKFVYNNKNMFIIFNLLFFITGAFFLSYTEANLGTAVRHKTIIMISLLSLYILYKSKNNMIAAKNNKYISVKYDRKNNTK